MSTFYLEVDLDNDECATFGPIAIADYLTRVADEIRDGGEPITGQLRDGNGNQIGTYWTEEGQA